MLVWMSKGAVSCLGMVGPGFEPLNWLYAVPYFSPRVAYKSLRIRVAGRVL